MNYNTDLQGHNTRLQDILNAVNNLPEAAAPLPELTVPAVESEVFLDKEFINESGEKKTGTFTIDSEVTQQRSLVSDIKAALEGKAAAGGGGESLESCTINFRLGDAPIEYFPIMHYINPDTMTVETITSASDMTVTIAAQTIMVLERTSSFCYMNGAAEQIFYIQTYAAYIVTGDCEYVIAG